MSPSEVQQKSTLFYVYTCRPMHLFKMKEENNSTKILDQENIPHVSNETGGLSHFGACSSTVRQFSM